MERSLVLVKPDAVPRGISGAIIQRFEVEQAQAGGSKDAVDGPRLAERHYAVHKGQTVLRRAD